MDQLNARQTVWLEAYRSAIAGLPCNPEVTQMAARHGNAAVVHFDQAFPESAGTPWCDRCESYHKRGVGLCDEPIKTAVVNVPDIQVGDKVSRIGTVRFLDPLEAIIEWPSGSRVIAPRAELFKHVTFPRDQNSGSETAHA